MTPVVRRQLNAISRRWIDDAETARPSSIKDRVYHYTDAAGLVGMLETGVIWLTDYRFLNDRTEILHIRSITDRLLAACDRDEQDEGRRRIAPLVRRWQQIDEPEDAFVFSLSEYKDDLSQWRGYAGEGLGFTIGFDAHVLNGRASADDNPFSFAPVAYDERIEERALDQALSELVKAIATGDKDDANAWDHAANRFDLLVASRGALLKHQSFGAEAEWRIIAYLKPTNPNIKVRVRQGALIPYIELAPQPQEKCLPITSIGIGPGFSEPQILHAVRALLRQHGYGDVETYSADTPYRRT